MSTKTTVYLPDERKRELADEARRRNCSEAQIVRSAIAAFVERPRPRAGVISGEPIASRVDELLVGFGE